MTMTTMITSIQTDTSNPTHHMNPDTIQILVSGIAVTCPVIHYNTYTCVVRLPDGHTIKRHLTHHGIDETDRIAA